MVYRDAFNDYLEKNNLKDSDYIDKLELCWSFCELFMKKEICQVIDDLQGEGSAVSRVTKAITNLERLL